MTSNDKAALCAIIDACFINYNKLLGDVTAEKIVHSKSFKGASKYESVDMGEVYEDVMLTLLMTGRDMIEDEIQKLTPN